jgi:hypothetical protein
VEQPWWQHSDAFAALGKHGRLLIEECEYQGGWDWLTKSVGDRKTLEVSGVGLRHGIHDYDAVVTIIQWDQIQTVTVAGPAEASRPRVSVDRALRWWLTTPVGLFGLLLKEKSALIVIGTEDGGEGVFQTTAYLSQDLRAKLAPVLRHYPDPPPPVPSSEAASGALATPVGPSVPDQIRQLAELRDSGILTEAEFQAKKAELLSRM